MNRYYYTKTLKRTTADDKKVRLYASTRYPKIDPTENDIYIFARTGDRLDNLAYEHYQDTSYWWVIALANNLGKGSLVVPPATQLRIPAKEYVDNIMSTLKQSSEE